jgi:hypothetical protein
MITITDAQRRVALCILSDAGLQPWPVIEAQLRAEGVENPMAELEGLIEALEIRPKPEE